MKEYTIIWSPLAEETYLKTLTQIIDQWSVKDAENFSLKVESLIEKLKKYKHLCPPSFKQKQFRRCVITTQTSLVYRIMENRIEIVAFFDNRSKNSF